MPQPGAAGAIWAAKRRRRGAPPPLAVSEKRIAEMRAELELSSMITRTMKQYDTNKSGKLERDQVGKLLTDIDTTTPKGTPPSDVELTFILKFADRQNKTAAPDNCIDRNELRAAVLCWNGYCKKRAEMEEAVKKYDKSETGKLEAPELKELLKELNSGCEVTDDEVSWVLEQSDVNGDGGLSAPELMLAIAQWYSLVEEKRNQCCIVL
eukprot:NODE_13444_length_1165_cov_7.260116.p1 GENE.NODE_13444_length_1165_cov_7.260116~~NODE_13444_length_1165_cov_7.260116.p1  ORF type:complete len:209 (-),score=71.42 NODE_13444_length_1165_cov_7.260116:456-1082(-)